MGDETAERPSAPPDRLSVHAESPFYVKPRLSNELLRWGWKFHRAATQARVDRAAPVLRDLHLANLPVNTQGAVAMLDRLLEVTGRSGRDAQRHVGVGHAQQTLGVRCRPERLLQILDGLLRLPQPV